MTVFVVIVGVSMGIVGILSVSKQKRTREEEIRERLVRGLEQIRIELENRIGDMINNVFSYPVIWENVKNPEYVRNLLKTILRENPIVQYPFIVANNDRFIFPTVPDTPPSVYSFKLPDLLSFSLHPLFSQGMTEEFGNRNFGAAISIYLQILKRATLERDRMLLTFVIARCYHKWQKFLQAISYLRDVEKKFSEYLKLNQLFQFTFLRQYAQTFQSMGDTEMMNRRYLTLYEKVLEFESATGSSQFSFFKNEALDLLNRFMSEEESKSERFVMAKQRDRLQELSDLDISLRWKFFDVGENQQFDSPDSDIEDRNLFLLIQDLLAPSDQKSAFYGILKTAVPWGDLAGSEMKIFELILPEKKQPVALKRFKKNFCFGFSLSEKILVEPVFSDILKQHIDSPGLNLKFSEKDLDRRFILDTASFQKYFPRKTLVLISNGEDFIQKRVRREMLTNYVLIGLLMVSLFLGIYLFFQYMSRESQLIRLKSEFFEGASHTLKTPLTRIRLLAEKMQLGWMTDKSRSGEYLGTIIQESDRMTGVIQNMLDYSRIEGGEEEIHLKQGSIPQVMVALIDRLKPQIESRNLKLESDIDQQIEEFFFDSEMICRGVSNLIQNSIKYSPDGGEILIRLFKKDRDVVLEVGDRGFGIHEKEADRVFEKFYRSPTQKYSPLKEAVWVCSW